MKHLVIPIKHILTVSCLVFWVASFLGFFIPAQAISDNSVADEIISLSVTDRPLGEVLENLSITANCRIRIDESWEEYPITASFDNEPLHRGLKLILRNINNAVIYGADRTIKIIVYDSGAPRGKAAGQPVTIKPPQEHIQPSLISGDATAPQPEVEVSESSNDTEYGERQPGESAESAGEENEADAENTEIDEDEPIDASSQGKTAASEAEEIESSPEEENGLTEESESSSGGSENSEITENNEESIQN